MKKEIWKFRINYEMLNPSIMRMPKNAEILSIQTQRNQTFLWALVDKKEALQDRRFECYATGEAIDYSPGIFRTFLGTCQITGTGDFEIVYVFHFFELTNK